MRAPLTPLKAFVHDAEQLGDIGIASSNDAQLSHWFAVAQAAERLATLAPHHRPEYLHVLVDAILPTRTERPTQIEGDGRTPVDALGQLAERLRLEAEDMERGSCFELALTTVSAVCQMLNSDEPTGRLLATAQLGRVNRQMGDLESAVDCYKTVADDALALEDSPIAAHGYIGLGNVAHARGNRPEQKLFFDRALQLAAVGSVARLSAHQGLLNVAISQGELAEALLHGWKAHDLAPTGSDLQYEILNGLATIAREAGFLAASTAGFDFVIERLILPRQRLTSIGGAIRTAARMRDVAKVESLEKLGRIAMDKATQPFESARFLLWAAQAWNETDRPHLCFPIIDEAILIAEQYGFHEVAIRGDQLRSQVGKKLIRSQKNLVPVWVDDAHVKQGICRLEALSSTP
jgi:tetratricopeptide (TPR) repeat protein